MSDLCPRCSGPVEQPARGRKRTYCSPACKSSIHEKQKRQAAAALRLPRVVREPSPLTYAIGRDGKRREPVPEPVEVVAPEVTAVEVVEDPFVDLEKCSLAELRVIAVDWSLSPDGDRETLTRRIRVAQGDPDPDPDPEPEPETQDEPIPEVEPVVEVVVEVVVEPVVVARPEVVVVPASFRIRRPAPRRGGW